MLSARLVGDGSGRGVGDGSGRASGGWAGALSHSFGGARQFCAGGSGSISLCLWPEATGFTEALSGREWEGVGDEWERETSLSRALSHYRLPLLSHAFLPLVSHSALILPLNTHQSTSLTADACLSYVATTSKTHSGAQTPRRGLDQFVRSHHSRRREFRAGPQALQKEVRKSRDPLRSQKAPPLREAEREAQAENERRHA